MKSLTEFLPEVLPHVPGCPQPVAVNAVRNSVIEFAGRALLLRQTVDVPVVAGVNGYELDVEYGTVPAVLLRGWREGGKAALFPVSPTQQDDENGPYWRKETGQPSKMYLEVGLLYLAPIPTEAETISVEVACTYSRSATRVDDFVFEDYIEDIARGTLGRLLLMPGQTWTNAEAALAYKTQFEFDINNAAISTAKGGTQASLVAAPRRFG